LRRKVDAGDGPTLIAVRGCGYKIRRPNEYDRTNPLAEPAPSKPAGGRRYA
jgi:hypothetical protein